MRRVVVVAVLVIAGCNSPEVTARVPCVDTQDYAPACGVDGHTYANPSVAACAGVAVDHEGSCADASTDGSARADGTGFVPDVEAGD